MNKPLIGVVPLYDVNLHAYYMYPAYMQAIEQAGGIPALLPLTDDLSIIKELSQRFDGFLFTGGQDVSPSLYNELERDVCGNTCVIRDVFEASLFKIVLHLNKPILGIGRGLQLFNVLLGGTLYQELSDAAASINHASGHTVSVQGNSLLHDIVQTDTLCVNSSHHQAIHNCAEDLIPCAISEDGFIEAAFIKDHPFALGVQWHPESQNSPENTKIFQEFVGRCLPFPSPAVFMP